MVQAHDEPTLAEGKSYSLPVTSLVPRDLRSTPTSELSEVRYTMHGRGLSAWQYCSAARTQQMTALRTAARTVEAAQQVHIRSGRSLRWWATHVLTSSNRHGSRPNAVVITMPTCS